MHNIKVSAPSFVPFPKQKQYHQTTVSLKIAMH